MPAVQGEPVRRRWFLVDGHGRPLCRYWTHFGALHALVVQHVRNPRASRDWRMEKR